MRKMAFIGVGIAIVALLASATQPGTGAADQAANRMFATGSSLEKMSAPLTEGARSETVTLLTGTIKTSSPKDLIFRFTAECALWTDVVTVGNTASESVAQVKVWVEMDGVVVPVSADDTGPDAGKVVLCNRAFKMETSNFDDENATMKTFLRTRAANGFNWFTFDAGSLPSPHEIVVKAQLETQVSGVGRAQAAIGKRTLIVEPENIANQASV